MTEGSLLDPTDWDEFRRHAHALLDRLVTRLEEARSGPVWRPLPEAVKDRLAAPPPREPLGLEATLAEMDTAILPYATGNTHPRFFGWVHGSGSAGGVLAEMTAAAMNSNCGGRDHGAIYVERALIEWARGLFGFPETTGGVLVTGTSTANLLGLAVARNHKAGHDARVEGLKGAPLVGYTSTEGHSSLIKAFEMLGLGRDALRRIPVDADYRLDLGALAARVKADRALGLRPFVVATTAGTVNTGAIDDLSGVADLCEAEDLWMHVDGAFGALGMLAPELAPRLAGLERADSLAFDFHKWLHVAYDAGCILVRDRALQLATFGGRPDYLASAGGLAAGDPWPSDLGIELSRGFRALKVWFQLREHGTDRLGQAIQRNCDQAKALEKAIGERPFLKVMAPVSLQIVCCRYEPPGLDAETVDEINARLVTELHLRGIAVPSTCRLNGRLCIRVSITNHRSQTEDFERLLDAIELIGADFLPE